MCGEKDWCKKRGLCALGSPPRVRGKVGLVAVLLWLFGITPACAGKRGITLLLGLPYKDHPRVCGEKVSTIEYKGQQEWITPACAGKSRFFSVFSSID